MLEIIYRNYICFNVSISFVDSMSVVLANKSSRIFSKENPKVFETVDSDSIQMRISQWRTFTPETLDLASFVENVLVSFQIN